MEPVVSVVIAAYNAENTIGEAMLSVGQTKQVFEIIVADDGSSHAEGGQPSDGSKAHYPKVVTLTGADAA